MNDVWTGGVTLSERDGLQQVSLGVYHGFTEVELEAYDGFSWELIAEAELRGEVQPFPCRGAFDPTGERYLAIIRDHVELEVDTGRELNRWKAPVPKTTGDLVAAGGAFWQTDSYGWVQLAPGEAAARSYPRSAENTALGSYQRSGKLHSRVVSRRC